MKHLLAATAVMALVATPTWGKLLDVEGPGPPSTLEAPFFSKPLNTLLLRNTSKEIFVGLWLLEDNRDLQRVIPFTSGPLMPGEDMEIYFVIPPSTCEVSVWFITEADRDLHFADLTPSDVNICQTGMILQTR